MLVVSQTQHPVKVPSEIAQATPLQPVWPVTQSPVSRPGVILAEGAGQPHVYHWTERTLLFSSTGWLLVLFRLVV